MKRYIPYFAAIIFLVLFLNQCSKTNQERNKADNKIDFLTDSIVYYKNAQGAEIASKIALQGDKKSLQILLNNTNDENGQLKGLIKKYKKVIAAGNIKQEIKIDTVKIVYRDTIPFKFERTWSKIDKFYEIKGSSNQNGISFDEIRIPNTLSFAIGDKKTGFFKTEYRIEAVNSNVHVKTTGLDAYTLSIPKKRFGLSFFAGYGLSENGLSPIIGAGFSYSFYQF